MARRESSLEAARGRLGLGPVRLTTSLDEALEGADLVIETIVEEAAPKQEVLARGRSWPGPTRSSRRTPRRYRWPRSPRQAQATGALCRSALPQSSRAGRARRGRRRRAHRARGSRHPRWLDGSPRLSPDRRAPRRSGVRRQPPPVRPSARGLRPGRRGCLHVRGRRPRGQPRPRRPLGGDRAVRDDGPRWARRPRCGCGESLAGARKRRRALADHRARARERRARSQERAGAPRSVLPPADAAALRDCRDRVLRALPALRKGTGAT